MPRSYFGEGQADRTALDRDLREAKDMVGRRLASTGLAAGALAACTNIPAGIDLTFIDGFPNTPGAYDRDDFAMAVAAAAKAKERLRQHAQRLVRQKKTDCDKADSVARARIACIELQGVPNRVDVAIDLLDSI